MITRLFAETDDGKTIEVAELLEASPDSGALILMCKANLVQEETEKLSKTVTAATGKPCLVLGPYVSKVLGV